MSTANSCEPTALTPKIFYLHIPKTGGQTLATRLASTFPIGKSDIIGSTLRYPEGVAELHRMFEEKQFIEKHVDGPVLQDFDRADLLLTIREPVAQIVSNYLHIQRDPTNLLHKLATTLAPQEFFTQFGDFLGNFQARYLTGALFEEDIDPQPLKILSLRALDAIDRFRWAVPTEDIDEFVTLWSLEMKRPTRRAEPRVNVARTLEKYESLLWLVRQMTHLYSVDLLLWHVAKGRYNEYRALVLRSLEGLRPVDDASCAFRADDRGIWLRDGWYPPQLGTPVGTAWWAGPGKYSEVIYRRAHADRYLCFSIEVLQGVTSDSIVAVQSDKRTRLPVWISPGKQGIEYCVDLGALPRTGSFWLWVPAVWAAVLIGGTIDDIERKSFATFDWRLSVSRQPADDVGALKSDEGDAAGDRGVNMLRGHNNVGGATTKPKETTRKPSQGEGE